MSTVKIEEETSYFEHQFGEQIMQPSPKNLIPFQNLLNECIMIRKHRQQMLVEPLSVRSKSPVIQINTKKLEEVNEEIQLLLQQKQSLQQMHNQLKYSIQSIQRNNNQIRQALQYYKDYDIVEMQTNDQEVITTLQTNTLRINAFQQLADKYKKQETKKLTLSKKDTQLQTEQLLTTQQKISQLKQINEGLLHQISVLKEEEAYKQKKLQECFKISEYIEFFIEIKSEFLQDDEDSPTRAKSDSIRPRNSTRNEVLNFMEEFYHSENIHQLEKRIIKRHHQLEQEQNLLKIQFHDLNEEKSRLIKEFDELNEELDQYKENVCDEQSRFIKNGSQEITVNNIIVEGHSTQHFNYQIKYHIRVNQMCIISMYQKFQDLLTRMSLALVWLQEYTKLVPLKIDNVCMKFLSQYTRQNFKLFIPKYNKIKSSQQKKGSFVSLSNRAQTPISGFHSPMMKGDISDSDAILESISRFHKCQNYEQIYELWKQLINNDLLTQKFTQEISLDGIDTSLDFQNIILKIYEKYAKQVKSSKYISHFEQFFQIYKDIIYRIRGSSSTKVEPDYQASQNLYFLKTANQQQINRLMEAKQASDIEEQKNHKMIKLHDESKYHEYFIIQSNKIQKQSPRIHEKLLSKTLQDIDNKKKLEMDQNYQTSELAQSEQDYLNQERRNLKGILNKKTSSQVSRQTTRLNDESFTSQKTIIKQMVLMDKLSKLKLIKKDKEYFKLDLKSLNQSIQRKLSDHYQMQDTLTHKFEPISSRKLKPLPSNTPVSRSYDPYQVFTPQSENILARVYDSSECFSKGKSFLVKR